MKDLMNKTNKLAEESKELFSRGMNVDDVVNELNASGLSEKIIKAAYASWNRN